MDMATFSRTVMLLLHAVMALVFIRAETLSAAKPAPYCSSVGLVQAAMASAENLGVRLKRKVRNAETNLFEWRPCSCTILARDGKLLLQLQTPPQDEDSQEELDGDTETVSIDLATQLLNVVPKKNKARCDLEYYAPVATMSAEVLKVELMASSAAHCQQWIAQVRRVQQQAHQQRRPSSARPTPAPVAPLPSILSSHVELNGSRSSRSSTTNGVAAVSSSIQSVSMREPSPIRRQTSCAMSGSELGQPDTIASPAKSQSQHSSSSLSSSAVSLTLPDSLAAVATAASCRVRERCDAGQTSVNDSEMECTIDSSCGLPAAAFEPVARSDTPSSLLSSISSVSTTVPPTSAWKRASEVRVSSPYYSSSSSSESEMPHSSHRRSHRNRPASHNRRDHGVGENNEHGSDDEHEPTQYRRQTYRRSNISDAALRTPSQLTAGTKLGVSSSSTHGSPRYRSSSRHYSGLNSALPRHGGDSYEEDGETSQAELHILQRVEAALRALELENAQAKARERELIQEVQTQRDAARVAAAERRHIEHEYRHARREIDSWRRAAQGAEAAAAQLQEQLGIARDETQLLAGEKLRLKRQNNELLTQVHRLDSLVYGRF